MMVLLPGCVCCQNASCDSLYNYYVSKQCVARVAENALPSDARSFCIGATYRVTTPNAPTCYFNPFIFPNSPCLSTAPDIGANTVEAYAPGGGATGEHVLPFVPAQSGYSVTENAMLARFQKLSVADYTLQVDVYVRAISGNGYLQVGNGCYVKVRSFVSLFDKRYSGLSVSSLGLPYTNSSQVVAKGGSCDPADFTTRYWSILSAADYWEFNDTDFNTGIIFASDSDGSHDFTRTAYWESSLAPAGASASRVQFGYGSASITASSIDGYGAFVGSATGSGSRFRWVSGGGDDMFKTSLAFTTQTHKPIAGGNPCANDFVPNGSWGSTTRRTSTQSSTFTASTEVAFV
jgi:hypothetical protein